MADIPTKDLLPPNVRAKRLKQGITYYWEVQTKDRKAGCTLANEKLGTDLAAAIVRAGELNAMLAEFRRGKDGGAGSTHGTVSWLFEQVEKHPKFTSKADKTKRGYCQGFELIKAYTLPKSGRPFSQVMVDSVQPRHVDRLYEALQWVEDTTEGGTVTKRRRLATANGAMRAARRAWSIGVRAGWAKANPFLKMELESTGGGTRAGTRGEVEAFIAQADKMGYRSMAAAAMLAFEFCQRESDVIGTIAWTDYRPGSELRIIQHKTGTPVWVPLYDEDGELFPGLVDRLDALPRRGTLIVMREKEDRRTKTFLPYKEDHFRHLFREIADAAGLPKDLKFMGLRHGGLTELGDAGATDQEMQSHGGHKTRQMLTVYSKPTKRQALNAARRRRALRTESAQSTENGPESGTENLKDKK